MLILMALGDLVQPAVDGYNFFIFAYGQTGFTIYGSDNNPGFTSQ